MKIRTGFVSNSSSSSFVLRGVSIKEEKLAKIWNVKPEKWGLLDPLSSEARKRKLVIHSTRYYFGGEETGEIVIGKSLGELPDGEVVGFDTPDDNEIKILLEQNDIPVKNLTTYVQYISNDNY